MELMHNHAYIVKCKKIQLFCNYNKKIEKSENRLFEEMGPNIEHLGNL